ncbi:ABC transporter ATP-binding protein [Weissella sp. MSCH1]|uniref:ABC transporter ATP-binding protein n=1 Tax=Weissella sp. MSCH1 TaxID=3383343 RepID=UPI003896EF4D
MLRLFIKSYFEILKVNWFASGCVLFLNITMGLYPVVSAILIQSIINNLVSHSNETGSWVSFLIAYIVLIIVMNAAEGILMYANGYLSNNAAFVVEQKILTRTRGLSLNDFESNSTYSTIEKLVNESVAKPFSAFQDINSMIKSIVALFSGATFLLSVNSIYMVAIIAINIVALPILINLAKRGFKIQWDRAEDERKAWYFKYLLTHEFSIKEVKMQNLFPYFFSRYKELKTMFIRQNLKILKNLSVFNLVYETMISAVTLVIITSVIISIASGKILIGYLTSVSQVTTSFSSNVKSMVNTVYTMTFDVATLKKLYDFIETDIQVTTEILDTIESISTIEFKDVSYKYGDSLVLDNINFEIKPNQVVALVGENGSGKSTLVKLAAGLYKTQEDAGEILVNGSSLNKYDFNSYRARVSVLFQDFVKYELTLKENIALGDVNEIDNDSKVEDKVEKLQKYLGPTKSDQQLGVWFENGRQLSGGQWQSVALSRAYMPDNANLFILDEPNSAMDKIKEDALFDEFNKFIKSNYGKMGLFVSHTLKFAQHADTIIVLNNGKIDGVGDHDELLKSSLTYRKMWEVEYGVAAQ